MSAPDAARVEEAGLNALQTQRQLFYDGWLLRLSPGKAKRARSVTAHFGSSRPLREKIDYCERMYAARDLPVLFRMTPFGHPHDLEEALAERGYTAHEPTLVQVAPLTRPPEVDGPDVMLSSPAADAFVAAVGAMRGSTQAHQEAHLERLRNCALDTHAVLATLDGQPVGAGQVMLNDGLAGVFDVVTRRSVMRRGIATRVVERLLGWAWEHGAAHAYLQVDAHNAPALAVYRKFGFATLYRYHYRARAEEFR